VQLRLRIPEKRFKALKKEEKNSSTFLCLAMHFSPAQRQDGRFGDKKREKYGYVHSLPHFIPKYN